MSRVIIVTGMHRSGTSLTSSLLQRAGIHLGEKLLAGDSGNPHGYFEDVDFYEFHDHLLHERGQTYLHVDSDFTFEPTAAEAEQAQRLVSERSHRPAWGWKDPRTSLFLGFWDQLLPDARFVFVYRHPLEVLLSLLRRDEFRSHPSFMAALNAWHTYNSNILTLFNRHPDRCLLVHIEGVTEQPAQFFRLLQEKLQLGSCVDLEAFNQIYHVNELKKTPFPAELIVTFARLFPDLLELYRQLNAQAELGNDEVCTDSTVSPRFSPLARFTETLAEPISLPAKQSLLQLMLWLLAPEPVEKALSRFNLNVKQSQLTFDQLWLHSQHLHRLNLEQLKELERRSLQITEQQQQLDHRCAQNAEQQQELERRSGQITEQQQDLARLQQVKTEQRKELDHLQQLTAQQSQTLVDLHGVNLEQSHELDRRSTQIESLAAELSNIYGTPVGKVLRSYRNLKHRWAKAA